MRRALRPYWRYLISAAALSVLVRYVGAHDLMEALRTTRGGPLLGYLAGIAVGPLLLAGEIWIALRLLGPRVSLRRVVSASVGAWSVGALTPARAGDFSMAYFLRPEVSGADTLSLVLLDKVMSVGALAVLGSISAAWVDVQHERFIMGAAALVLALIIVSGFSVRSSGAGLGGRLGGRFLGGVPSRTLDALQRLLRKPSVLIWLSAAAVTRWVYLCAVNLLVFRAVGENPGFGHVVAATSIGRIISLVPVTVGGVGLKEPVQIPIYAEVGVSPKSVVAVSIIGMACVLLTATVYPLVLRSGARDSEVGGER
jgi:uncharacterized membrane protein YbhN (UPF0104 family)